MISVLVLFSPSWDKPGEQSQWEEFLPSSPVRNLNVMATSQVAHLVHSNMKINP